jgi:hypothetical protein
MTKYRPSDDGTTVDGKVVVFLKPGPRKDQQPPDKRPAQIEADGDAPADPPGTIGGIAGAPYAIEIQLFAAGGTPLAAERVRVVDPDSQEDVGSPGVSDEQGIFRAGVPEEKEYQLFAVVDGIDQEIDAWSAEGSAPGDPVAGDEHPMLIVLVVDGQGVPLVDEAVQVKAESGESWDLKTDARGRITLECEAGLFTVTARGTDLLAHSVFNGDLYDETAPCKLEVAS